MRRGASLSIHVSWPVRLPETFTESGGTIYRDSTGFYPTPAIDFQCIYRYYLIKDKTPHHKSYSMVFPTGGRRMDCHTRMGKKIYGRTPAFRLNGENQDHHYQRHIE